jgi:hypothetical protein
VFVLAEYWCRTGDDGGCEEADKTPAVRRDHAKAKTSQFVMAGTSRP